MMALTDKRARARTIVHDVPENTIINVLSSYGILKHMLPTVMGGDLVFDQSQWILTGESLKWRKYDSCSLGAKAKDRCTRVEPRGNELRGSYLKS